MDTWPEVMHPEVGLFEDGMMEGGEQPSAPSGVPHDLLAQAVAHGAVRYHAPSGGSYLVVHHNNAYRLFLNRCPHRRLPLDRGGHVLYTADRAWLVCVNHGAKFHPLTGECVAGPCVGKHLQRLPHLPEI